MTDRNRRTSRRLVTGLAATCLALALPAGALANHGESGARRHDRGHDSHRRVEHRHRYDRYDRHDRYDRYRGSYGWGWGHHRRPRPYPVHVHGSACGHRQSDYGYYCRPCGQRYDSIDHLHHHVHHVHHIPFWKVPFVIFAKAMGHYYYG